MARRYSGDLVVDITYYDDDTYKGSVYSRSNRAAYAFDDLHAPAIGLGSGIAYDSPVAYDVMAAAAIGFASYDDDAFDGYDSDDSDERGEPLVRRSDPNKRRGR